MKRFFLAVLVGAVMGMPASLNADDAATNALAAGSATSEGTGADGQQCQRRGKMKEALAELGLTDAQKEQIKQIRANTPKGKERRQQIMAVLTPDQKAKLLARFKERHTSN